MRHRSNHAGYLLSMLLSAACLLDCGCETGSCAECRDEKCSDLVAYCVADPDCKCMSDCLGREGIPGIDGCLGSCGLTERPAGFLPVEECVVTACPDSDECSTPGNYFPPGVDTGGGMDAGDIGGGDLEDCSFDLDLGFDPEGSVLQLESEDGNICVRLERRNDGGGSLANTSWTALDIRVGTLGAVARITDPSALCYYSSHHNFRDWVHVWTGTRRHDLMLEREGWQGARNYLLHTFEQGPLQAGTCAPLADGTGPIGDPVELVPFNP